MGRRQDHSVGKTLEGANQNSWRVKCDKINPIPRSPHLLKGKFYFDFIFGGANDFAWRGDIAPKSPHSSGLGDDSGLYRYFEKFAHFQASLQ